MLGIRSTAMLAAIMATAGGIGGIGSANVITAEHGASQSGEPQLRTGTIGHVRSVSFSERLAASLGMGQPFKEKKQRRSGPGWSNRHVKRLAVKTRNIKRHRAVMKRAK